MYYQEKWENGLLYVKTSPNGMWNPKHLTLADLQQGVEGGHISISWALDLAYLLGNKTDK